MSNAIHIFNKVFGREQRSKAKWPSWRISKKYGVNSYRECKRRRRQIICGQLNRQNGVKAELAA